MILYTIDNITVDDKEFKERKCLITDAGYYNLPQDKRTWVHIGAERQIIMAKTMHGNDGNLHTFRVAIDT